MTYDNQEGLILIPPLSVFENNNKAIFTNSDPLYKHSYPSVFMTWTPSPFK